jgi:hypothetical protein
MRDDGKGTYPTEYGAWAGNPKGHKPDLKRCCVTVHGGGRWASFHQCHRKRGHGPNNAYCAQHNPSVVEARNQKRDARHKAEWQKRLIEIHGQRFYDALVKIADGHNDARGVARDAIKVINQ